MDADVLLDARGRLVVGTAGIGIGKLDDDRPVPDQGLPPVSHAKHDLVVASCADLLVEITYGSFWKPAGEEPSFLQAEVRDTSNAARNVVLVTDGFGAFATGALPAGEYTLHLFHLVGPPVEYAARVRAFADATCA